MARSTAQLLSQLLRFLPEQYQTMSPILAGFAAQLAEMESTGEAFADSVTVGGADGRRLTLLAHGYGIRRGTGEADEALRSRLRNPARKLVRSAILDAVNAVLAEAGVDGTATMIEWWEAPAYFNLNFYCGLARPSTFRAFLILLPALPVEVWYGGFMGVSYFNRDAYMGSGTSSAESYPYINLIREQLYTQRAAGVRAFLAVEPS